MACFNTVSVYSAGKCFQDQNTYNKIAYKQKTKWFWSESVDSCLVCREIPASPAPWAPVGVSSGVKAATREDPPGAPCLYHRSHLENLEARRHLCFQNILGPWINVLRATLHWDVLLSHGDMLIPLRRGECHWRTVFFYLIPATFSDSSCPPRWQNWHRKTPRM